MVDQFEAVEGPTVNDIIVDTDCTQTMVHEDPPPTSYNATGETVQIRCAHGDATSYPLAYVHLDVEGVKLQVTAAVSQTLPVSVLLSTDSAGYPAR